MTFTHFFRLWAQKLWDWLLAEEQAGDVRMGENHIRQISHYQNKCFLHPRQIPFWRAAAADSSSHPPGGGESWIHGAVCRAGHHARLGSKGRGKIDIWDCFLFYHFLPDPPPPISQLLCSQVNVTNLHSCWFLWALQVLQREVGLSISTEESRLPRAEEWQKCPHVFCLWHRCWWESFYHTARPVHATLTRVLQMFPLSLACCGLLGFSLPSSFVS